MKLLNFKAHDGSRQFLTLPESIDWNEMRDHIAALPGAKVTDYLTDHVTEVWIDFSFHGHAFTVNNQFGEYWFFVKDSDCPDNTLLMIAGHCAARTNVDGKA